MKKRVKLSKFVPLSILSFFFVIGIVAGIWHHGVFLKEGKSENIVKETEVSDQEVVEEEKVEVDPIKEYNLSLVMAGDALIHGAVYGDAKVGNSYDFKGMLSNIKPIISSYDLAYYNQETILGGKEMGLSSYPRFNSPYEVGDAFIDAGFNIVSLANNHTLDRGEKAIVNSRNYWNSKDVMVNGSATSLEERNNIDIREKNGISYAMISYTTTTNGLTRKNNYHVNWYDKETVKADIESIKDKVDVIMVAMHWGTEYNTGVSSSQKEIANYLASLGVDIVIGAHPHVIEPCEYIGDTFVIYSLGNIISAQDYGNSEKLSGLLMSVNIKKVEDTSTGEVKISIEDPIAEFIYTYSKKDSSGRHSFKLYPYSMLNEGLFSNYKSMYEKLKTRVTSLDSSIKVKGLEGEIDGDIE